MLPVAGARGSLTGRLADWLSCGTAPLRIFTLIASLSHMYSGLCVNNNPKQQEGDALLSWNSGQVGSLPATLQKQAQSLSQGSRPSGSQGADGLGTPGALHTLEQGKLPPVQHAEDQHRASI